MATDAEQKCENFKLFLLPHARLKEDKDLVASMTWPLLKEFVRTFVVAEYKSLKAFRDAPLTDDKAAQEWVRNNKAIQGEAATFMLGYIEFATADVILKVVRYLVLFVELISIEDHTPPLTK